MKYVLVTGGVVSGLGKGVTASSVGVVLKNSGVRCTSLKIDPYLNVDAGTMSPFEHGEVFVLDDGGEADLDLGNYERFLDVTLRQDNNLTTGKIYQHVIEKERRGDYLGKTVQVVPHVTDAIMNWIERVAHVPVDGTDREPEVCIIELGGTVGDIESAPFVEALRQFQYKVGDHNFCCIHVSLVPTITSGEQKTKPTQHSVAVLRSLGINPTIVACRCLQPLEDSVRSKLALFCQVPAANVLNLYDVTNIWRVPLVLEDQGVHHIVTSRLGIADRTQPLNLTKWRAILADRWDDLTDTVTIALVGKYTELSDAYLSVIKALQHSCLAANVKLDLQWVEGEKLEEAVRDSDAEGYGKAWGQIEAADGILVPGGFGTRGTEGKILAAGYARTHKTPYLGICLGMQLAVVEFARNVCGMKDAASAEFEPATPQPVVVFMPEGSTTHKGGTMRLGSRTTLLHTSDCISAKLYRSHSMSIDERHRHRYEVNPDMVETFEAAGMRFVGTDDTGTRMEIIELEGGPDSHPFYVGAQFHPEFKSRPGRPAPLFLGFVLAASKNLDGYLQGPTKPSPNKIPHITPQTTPQTSPFGTPTK